MTEKTYKNFQGGLKINKEYANLIPPLNEVTFNGLKSNIERDGRIIDPLIVDENKVILDGHNRYKIAEMLDMSISTTTKDIKDIDEGKLWIIQHQIRRRELTLVQKAVIGLSLKPYFSKLCKERQSQGGTNKEKLEGSLKTSQLMAKEVDVNETLIKEVIGVEKYLPNLLPLLGLDKISIMDAKFLKKKNQLGIIKKENVLKKGELSEEAKGLLDEYHNPTLSEKEIELRDSETKTRRLREKVEADNKKKDEILEKNAFNNTHNPVLFPELVTIRNRGSYDKKTEVTCNLQHLTGAGLRDLVRYKCNIGSIDNEIAREIRDIVENYLKEDKKMGCYEFSYV